MLGFYDSAEKIARCNRKKPANNKVYRLINEASLDTCMAPEQDC